MTSKAGGGLAAVAVLWAAACGDSGPETTGPTPVPNRGPEAVGAIPAHTVSVGETATVVVSPYFRDADGDALSHAAASSNPGVAGVSVSGGSVILAALAKGVATVTVEARDPQGLIAQQRFQVTVPNRIPEAVDAIPNQTVATGQTATVDASAYFSDPDGDPLTYSATSSAAAVVSASVSGSTLTLTGVAVGTATVTATARDPDGGAVEQVVHVTVPNRGPVAVGSIPARTVSVGDSATIDVSSYFSDPDGDVLSYAAASSDVGIASVAIVGDTLELSGKGEGRATISVTAADPGGLSAALSFQVTVSGDESPPGSFQIELRLATAMSAAQKAAFERASARWMAILADTELPDMPVPEGVVRCSGARGMSYEESVSVVDDLLIIAAVAEIDGDGGTLGQAGVCEIGRESRLPWFGLMEFDAADLTGLEENGTLEAVILHEMGHVLGIGSLWSYHELLRNPSLFAEREVDTHFTGTQAIRAFDGVGGASYTAGAKVPVENRGTRPGSDDSHWRKNVFGNELMSPSIADDGSSPLSAVTVASLADLGYAVRMDLADAYRLPGAAALLKHQRRAIDLGNDVIRIPVKVRDGNGRVVGVIRP